MYEAYDAYGVGFFVIVRTDNKMRTGAEVRHIFDLHGGSMGGPGSTSYLFSRNGSELSVTIPLEIKDAEQQVKIQELLDDLEEHDDVEAVYTNAIWEGKER